MLLIFGGGDIAEQGIIPIVGGTIAKADVTNPLSVAREIREHRPDVVINCAGVSHPGTIAEQPDWHRELMVNLAGSFHVAQEAVAEQVDTLIFIASVAGLAGKPNHAGYSASKAGVISLVSSLGFEGHDAYAISPGRVDTKMREKDYPGEDPRTRLDPKEIGHTVADILFGKYQPGDNIILRKIGFEQHQRLDRGEPWREWLRVGQPVTV